MKKILALLLCIAMLACVLAGCGEQQRQGGHRRSGGQLVRRFRFFRCFG